MPSLPLSTERLVLVPATPELIREAFVGDAALARSLGAQVPDDWPPEFYDADALAYTLERLESGEASGVWTTYFFLRAEDRMLLGIGGYHTAPSEEGAVEVGYSVVPTLQGHGYATEATGALVDRAFEDPAVTRVVATTLPHLTPSIRVVEKLGFARSDVAPEPGVIAFVRSR